MFNYPIRRTSLKSVEEVKKYSYLMNEVSSKTMVRCQNNGQIAFVDEKGLIYVTPYRSEIPEILGKAGYKEDSLYVPFSNGGNIPESYKWLKKIALQEYWADTHLRANMISVQKNIDYVDLSSIDEKMHVCEFLRYEDKDTKMIYHNMVDLWIPNGEENNIGTYIIIDKKTLIVCDEYGRTFLIKVKSVIYDIVNKLIDAGYRHNPNPAKYVSFYEPEEEPLKEPELPVDAIV